LDAKIATIPNLPSSQTLRYAANSRFENIHECMSNFSIQTQYAGVPVSNLQPRTVAARSQERFLINEKFQMLIMHFRVARHSESMTAVARHTTAPEIHISRRKPETVINSAR
jgi:hypothetical protein